MNQGIIVWGCKKQSNIARSTTEARFVALDNSTRQIMYLNKVYEEIIEQKLQVKLYGDNLGSIKLSQNPVSHQRAKHIDIVYLATRKVLEKNAMRHYPLLMCILWLMIKLFFCPKRMEHTGVREKQHLKYQAHSEFRPLLQFKVPSMPYNYPQPSTHSLKSPFIQPKPESSHPA